MKRIFGFLGLMAGFVLVHTAAAQQTTLPRRIPTSDFAKHNSISGPKLSPDGRSLLARTQIDTKSLLVIHNMFDGKHKLVSIPDEHDLRWYRWAGNGRIIFSLAKTVPWFDDEAEATRLVAYELETGAIRQLGAKAAGLEGDDLLYVDPSGDWLLLSFQRTIYDYPSVFRITLADNKMQEVVKQRADVWEWYADNDGIVRAGIGFADQSWSMVYRKNDAEKFRKIGKAKYDDEESSLDLITFGRDSDEGFVLRNHETGRYALYKYNYATRQLGERVFESPTNDISSFDTTDDGKTLRAVWYTDERDRVAWFDEGLKKIQSDIDAAVKSNEAWITSRTKDNSAMIVSLTASNNPGNYYYYQPAVGTMQRLATRNQSLKASELSPTQYVKYKARDGLEIAGYLTIPRGRDAKKLPLIIHPHGGPHGVRDTPDYNAEVQFMANRGYAVFQPNFRGSEGYGKSFYEKGEGQWGRQMQDDLDDGMDWLSKEGIIDPQRVCIVGSSYGGYAAMWGVTRNPERYRCGASFAGVMDLGRQLKYQLDFGISRRYRKNWRNTVLGGDKSFDAKTVSPLHTIDRLTRPVLIVHGDADQTVPYKQSKLYADALKKAGKQHEFFTYAKEGHGFSDVGNLKDWLDKLDAFLAKHNPAG